jgi:hypothetical protein
MVYIMSYLGTVLNDELGRVWPELVAVFQTCLVKSEESMTPLQKNNTCLQINVRTVYY